MESADLEMEEIFDDNDIDEDIGATGVLPDLPEATQTQNDDEENAEVLARLKDLSKGAAKKVVRKPQPKLDPTRLTGDRGIPILPKLFKDVKFKGKGHEAQDLATLMGQMEHWAHRLFPKMPFDEVIERIEKLGNKKEVQTCVKKIRLDMPILDEDFVGSDRDEEDDVIRRGEENAGKEEVRADDMWDELLKEEAELTASQEKPDSGSEQSPTSGAPPLSPPAGDTEMFVATPLPQSQKETDKSGGFTPEQLARIERNKQLAMERRLKKMGQLTPGAKTIPSQVSSKTAAIDETIKSQTLSRIGNIAVEGVGKTLDGNETFEGSCQNLNSGGEDDRQTLKSLDKGSDQTQKLTAESDREETESASQNEGMVNNEPVVETDTEMSEVIEKGLSQNITVAGVPNENAQNWHTGPAVGTDSGLTLGSGNSGETESMEVGSDPVLENSSTSKAVSETVGWQTVKESNSSTSTTDSQEMSELIGKQDAVKIILKEKPGILNSETPVEKVAGNKTANLINSGVDINRKDKENKQQNGDLNVGKDTERSVKEKLGQTKDNMCNVENVENFDDELTEEQLMDTLEC